MNNVYYPGNLNQSNDQTGASVNSNNYINKYQPEFLEMLIKNNIGKMATIYMSYPNSNEWKDKSFTGIIEDSGQDYILISDSRNGKWYLLPTIYLNYIIFEEQINHN